MLAQGWAPVVTGVSGRDNTVISQSLGIAVLASAALTVIHPFFQWKHNGRPAGNGWNRSTNNAQWGIDYFNRTGTAKSNMFDNRPNETQYFYTDYDGAALSSPVTTATRSRFLSDRTRRSTASGH